MMRIATSLELYASLSVNGRSGGKKVYMAIYPDLENAASGFPSGSAKGLMTATKSLKWPKPGAISNKLTAPTSRTVIRENRKMR